MKKQKLLTTKNIAVIGIMGALSGLLMMLEIPLLFVAPDFYKLDFSEVPVMIVTFALGPLAGVLTELVKLLVKFMIKGTSTGGVGELANFIIGCAMLIPAGLIYHHHKTRKTALIGLGLGTVSMTVIGAVMNALVLLPFYATLMPMDVILAAGAKIFPQIDSVWSFALYCVAPFNFIKGVVISAVTFVLYKRVSRLIKEIGREKDKGQ